MNTSNTFINNKATAYLILPETSRYLRQKDKVKNNTFSNKLAYYQSDVINYSDDYPFGMLQPNRSGGESYRYNFQGQETDDEVKGKGNSSNFKYRMSDNRLGRFFAIDPLTANYPHNSPYAFSENDVIRAVELEGGERKIVIFNDQNQIIKSIDFYTIEEGAHGEFGYGVLHIHNDGKTTYKDSYKENGLDYRYTGKLTGDELIQKTKNEIYNSRSIFHDNGYIERQLDNKQVLKSAERYVLRRYPAHAYNSRKSDKLGLAVGEVVDSKVGGIYQGKADAVRHAFWTAYMSVYSSKDFAREFSTAHEADRPQDGNADHIMDLNNNSVGIDVVDNITFTFYDRFQTIYNKILERGKKGELMLINPSTGEAEHFTFTDKEYEELKKIDISNIQTKDGEYIK